jgi:microcin C transport system substrate-binding protein
VLAADVVHSFKTLISKQAAPQFRSIYAEVKDAVAVGERIVRFDFASPNAELPLIVGSMPVFSREWGQGKPFDQVVTDIPIASGPYRLASPRMGRDVTYVRDPQYWGRDLPVRKGQYNFDRVTWRIYLDETSRFEGLKAGEFDFMREFISRNWARQYRGRAFESGELLKRPFANQNPGDFQGYVFNLRKAKFQDRRVREAIALAFDFEWMNRQLFYGIYKRVDSYFPNSEFRAEGLPGPEELALLEPLRAQLLPEVFGPPPAVVSTAAPESLRQNLRRAQALLAEAGWRYRDGALRNAQGEAFTIEFLSDQPSLVRIVTPFQKALEKLGITLTFRSVDFSLAKQKMDTFDFELTSARVPGSSSPGIELVERFGSEAARTPGSSNAWGIADPAVDALMRHALAATTRDQLRTALRALDRVLRHGHYSVPHYYGSDFLIGYRPGRFGLPAVIPPYYDAHRWAVATWWPAAINR